MPAVHGKGRAAGVRASIRSIPAGGSLEWAPPTLAVMRTPTAILNEDALARLLDELGREATARRFEVAPNPCVGAALLAGTEVLARGVHGHYGGPHAEIEAMRAAGAAVLSADTLVVTLEPCSTHGKTPPCVDAILAAGIGRVVVGALDPDPRHRGRGIELLREKGLEVVLLEGVAPLAEVAPHFLHWTDNERLRRPRPNWALLCSAQRPRRSCRRSSLPSPRKAAAGVRPRKRRAPRPPLRP